MWALVQVCVRDSTEEMMKAITLSNGMKLVMQPETYGTQCAIMFWVRAGSLDETPLIRGISHFMEHMMFRGTERYPRGEMGRLIHAVGGVQNAMTSFDYTCYMALLPREQFSLGLALLADALMYPRFAVDDFNQEREIVTEEIKMRLDQPPRFTFDQLREIAFTQHRYREEIKGSEDTLRGMTPEIMRDYWQRMYGPGNIIATVTGDFDSAVVEREFCALAQQWLPRPIVREPTPGEPTQTSARCRSLSGDLQQAHLRLGFHSEGLISGHEFAYMLLGEILSVGYSSRLYRALIKTGLASACSAGLAISGRDIGLFNAYARFDSDNGPKVIAQLVHEFAKIAANGPDPDELEQAKNHIEANFLLASESLFSRAAELGIALIEENPSSYFRFLEHVRSVAPADVKLVAQTIFQPHRINAILYVPRSRETLSAEMEWTERQLEQRLANALSRDATANSMEQTSAADEGSRRTVTVDGPVVITRPFKIRPLFGLAALWAGGTINESEGTSGITHLMLSTVLRNKNREGIAWTNVLEGLGASVGSLHWHDGFGFLVTGLSRNMKEIVGAFGKLLSPPDCFEDEFNHVKALQSMSLRKRMDDLQVLAGDRFLARAFPSHPYGRPLLGTESAAGTISLAAATAWFSARCPITQLRLLLAGDYNLSSDEAIAIVGRDLPVSGESAVFADRPIRAVIPASPDSLQRQKNQTTLLFGFGAPGAAHPDAFALRVLSALLNDSAGQMWRVIREDRGLCYDLSTDLELRRLSGFLTISMGTSPDKEAAAIDGLREMLGQFVEQGAQAQDVERAKNMLLGGRERAMESLMHKIYLMARHEVLGDDERQMDEYPKQISKVTVNDVTRVIQVYLGQTPSLVVIRPGSPGS